MEALKSYWGRERLAQWLAACPERTTIETIGQEDLGEQGFPSLRERIMDKTDPEDVRQFLREVGTELHRPVQVVIGGVVALILPGLVSRATEDIDIVDEVPGEVQSLHSLLARLQKRYGLQLTHFQSHYLPAGWDQRLHSLGSFGQIRVFLVDAYDVFLSKLFSAREKDRDDLRVLVRQLDKDMLVRRLRDTTTALRTDLKYLPLAEKNWYILYGEPLPSES
jgi:hypothetical protein